MPEKAIPEESVAVIQLLRDALNELINNNNEVPQNRVDEVYENVISSLNVPNDENPRRNGRRKGKQGGRRTRRRYVNGSMPEQVLHTYTYEYIYKCSLTKSELKKI
jgi:hypothetical protein